MIREVVTARRFGLNYRARHEYARLVKILAMLNAEQQFCYIPRYLIGIWAAAVESAFIRQR